MSALFKAWRERPRTLRGAELSEYEAGWRAWRAKYGGHRTRDGRHYVNSSGGSGGQDTHLHCKCGFSIVNAPNEELLLTELRKHIEKHQPEQVDLGGVKNATQRSSGSTPGELFSTSPEVVERSVRVAPLAATSGAAPAVAGSLNDRSDPVP